MAFLGLIGLLQRIQFRTRDLFSDVEELDPMLRAEACRLVYCPSPTTSTKDYIEIARELAGTLAGKPQVLLDFKDLRRPLRDTTISEGKCSRSIDLAEAELETIDESLVMSDLYNHNQSYRDNRGAEHPLLKEATNSQEEISKKDLSDFLVARNKKLNLLDLVNKLVARDINGKLINRGKGMRKALYAFLNDLKNHQPLLYQTCFEQATKLNQTSPLKKSPKALICVSMHHDEQIEKFLEACLKQYVDHDEYPVYIFVNGQDQEKINHVIKRIHDFQTNHNSLPNLRILSQQLSEWRNGFKAICVNTALMDYALSGNLKTSDADVPLIFHDADIVDMPADLWTSHAQLINYGAVMSSGKWKDDFSKIGEQNINYHLLAAIHNTDIRLFYRDMMINKGSVSTPHPYDPNLNRNSFWMCGANSATSAIMYSLIGGISVLADSEEKSLWYPIEELLAEFFINDLKRENPVPIEELSLWLRGIERYEAHEFKARYLHEYLARNYYAWNDRSVTTDGGAILRSVANGVPVIDCMCLHGSSLKGDLSKDDFNDPNCVNVSRLSQELKSALNETVKTILHWNHFDWKNNNRLKSSACAEDLLQILRKIFLTPMQNEMKKINKQPSVTWSTGVMPNLDLRIQREHGSGNRIISFFINGEFETGWDMDKLLSQLRQKNLSSLFIS